MALVPTGSPARQESGKGITNSKGICPRVPEVTSKETQAQSSKQQLKARREQRCCVAKGNKTKNMERKTHFEGVERLNPSLA